MLELAPDDAARRASRSLARPGVWSELGSTPSLVWGKCQGSGKTPYQVTVDLSEPAFRCTCPSRKFPCKHGVALLLLWVEGEGSVAEVEHAAGFAAEWADERAARTGRRAARAEKPAAERDPEAQAKRQADREALMTAGVAELELWLLDLVRQGLASARNRPYSYWDGMAARLVDTQLPALADRVRAAGAAVHARPDWAEHLLAECGRLYLAVRAWPQRAELPPDVAADLRTYVGWPLRAEDVLAGERVRDDWVVVGRRLGGDERLQSQRTWLAGRATGELVLHLDFAAGGAAFKVKSVVGTVVRAELALYPGSRPRRAMFTGDEQVVDSAGAFTSAAAIEDSLQHAARTLADNPWTDRIPATLASVRPAVDGGAAWLVDGNEDAVAVAAGDDGAVDVWPLAARSEGRAVDVFGELHDGAFTPATVAVAGQLVPL